ncbi:hypothetical protein ABPG75_006269 [Micractinium tetrahymenae]
MHVSQGLLNEQQQPQDVTAPFVDPGQGVLGPQERRRQQRLLRQKKAKLLKRAAAQESNDGTGADEDDAVELAYEQHLRQLQQLHPSSASPGHQQQLQRGKGKQKGKRKGKRQQQQGAGGSQQAAGGQQKRQAAQRGAAGEGSGAKRQRRAGGAAAPAVAGSVDTLASAAALAVPAAHPVQQQAQISGLSADPAVAPAAAAAADPAVPQLVLSLPTAPAATAVGQLTGASQQQAQQAQQPDASAVAAMVEQAMMEEEADSLAAAAASKTAGICRLDLSAAALLISSHLAPCVGSPACPPGAWAGGSSGQGLPVEPAAAGTAAGADAAEGALVEDATQAAAGEGEGEGRAAAAAAVSRRAQRRVYIHGNYHRYYGYRFFGTLPADGQPGGQDGAAAQQQQQQQQQQPEDPRLAAFERKWFARRRCLDVGCNEGVVTLALVQRFCPRSMLGVDIDGVLVAKANRHLHDLRAAMGERIRASRRAGVAADERRAARAEGAALSATRFVCADFVESQVPPGSVDTITCLSVTKWVHLNRGDAGLQALFAAFWSALSRGGVLLLEPQPWSSYRAAAGKIRRDQAPPGSFFHRQDELLLRPDAFADYLCDQLGFRLVRRLGVDDAAAPGFDRPMLLLRKPI